MLRWRVSVDLDCVLRQSEDALGNIVHSFSTRSRWSGSPLRRSARSRPLTRSAWCRARRSRCRTRNVSARQPESGAVTAKLREILGATLEGASDTLDRLHRLMGAIHSEIAFDPRRGGRARRRRRNAGAQARFGGRHGHLFHRGGAVDRDPGATGDRVFRAGRRRAGGANSTSGRKLIPRGSAGSLSIACAICAPTIATCESRSASITHRAADPGSHAAAGRTS